MSFSLGASIFSILPVYSISYLNAIYKDVIYRIPENNNSEIQFHLYAYPIDEYYSDIKSSLSNYYQLYTPENGYELVSISSYKIGVFEGEQIIYSYVVTETSEKSLNRVLRIFCFTQGKAIFIMAMTANENVVDTANADFEDIIGSVKILQSGSDDNYHSGEYKIFLRSLGIFDVSFEYPSDFEQDYLSYTKSYIGLQFMRSTIENNYTGQIQFNAYDKTKDAWSYFKDVETAVNIKLGDLGAYDNLEVLDRSSVHINGLSGEKVICRYQQNDHPVTPYGVVGLSEGNPFFIHRFAFFQLGDYIWEVSLLSQENTIEADNAFFDYLIQTVRIH